MPDFDNSDQTLRILRNSVRKEFDRAVHFSNHPEEATELLGIGKSQLGPYYKGRADGMEYILEAINRMLTDD